jgi:chemotaxis protein methyltransferase CheR
LCALSAWNADVKNIHPHLLANLNDFVETRMGLYFPPARLGDLERGICAAAVEFGFTHVESCIYWLLSSVLSQIQIETLASHLTVGETHFFRDARVFEILETHILSEIIDARRGRAQNLRIWSAACSSGEEPYSVAILLARMLPDLQDWNISILATDIAPPALKKASAGVYREWSFRDTPRWVREGYFKKINRTFEIAPHIKRMVRFSCLNLAEDPYPAIINATNAMDIIFCRNVLMYFSRRRAHAVLENLSRCLVGGGWLVVSPVDAPGPVFPSLLQPVRFSGAILFQKGPRQEDDGRRPATMPEQTTTVQKTAAAGTVGKTIDAARPRRPDMVPEAPGQTVNEIGEMAKQARQLADRGRLADALVLCEEAIKYDRLNPTLPYLQATILQEMGRADEAATALQRALYIDQEFVIAHFALGHLLQRQGRNTEAGKHLKKALALLNAFEKGDIPPEAEGMSAGRLIELIKAMQDSEGQGGMNERRAD